MGLFQHQYYDWREAAEFGSAGGLTAICSFCNQPFEKQSPNQKRHRRGDNDDMEATICDDEYWKAHLSPKAFVEKILGMSKAEYVEQFGLESFQTL